MSAEMPQVGALPLDVTRTRFTVWAPRHERLRVRFPADGRVEAMSPQPHGYHVLEALAPAGTLYQLEFADGRLRPDPASRAQPHGVHGPSMVTAIPHRPDGGPFANPPLARHVLYELHVGTFTPEGTFDAIVPRLAALRDLGVTAIELMPIAQFPGARNWGYDGVCPFAAQASYGGQAGLLRLVRACHAHGLALLLDVVFNHLGPEGNYLDEFGPYFTDRYRTPWGAALNFDGPDSDHVREFFLQASLHWTRDCGVDGLRLDAVHAIVDHTARTFLEDLAERIHTEAQRLGRRILVIAESCDNDPRLVRPPEAGGVGLDGCWNDDYHHAVRAAITGERRGYYAPFGAPDQIARAVRDRFVFTGQYSSHYRRRHGAPAVDVEHGRLIVFTQNHDQVGNRPLGDRLDATAGLDGARLAAALTLLSPFTPLLWMGEEYAESAPFLYFVSHGDADLVEAVRRGRANEFADFAHGAGAPDPQSDDTFRRSRLDWTLRERGAHATMLAYYAELLRLRQALDLPGRAAGATAFAQGPAVVLTYAMGRIVVVGNTAAQPADVRVWDESRGPAPAWTELLDSSDGRWGGPGRQPRVRRSAATLPVGAKAARVLCAESGSQ